MHDLVKFRLISGWILARVEYSLANHITMLLCTNAAGSDERGFICKGGGGGGGGVALPTLSHFS